MLEPDTLLHNRYQVVRAIGQKARSVIYEAYDQQLGAPVAIKARYGTDEYPVEAFERPVRARAWLTHAALPSVRDRFIEDGVFYLVMAHVSGESLLEQAERQQHPFAPDDVLRWADQILDTLHYLHQRQPPVFHRDIKPQNLKLTERNDILLLDLQLASAEELYDLAQEAGSSTLSPYIPPELWTDGIWEASGDIYALGATSYYLLTATAPPTVATRLDALQAGDVDPLPPAATVNPGIPQDLSELLGQMLHLDPADRPTAAASLRSSLRYIAVGKPGPAENGETASQQETAGPQRAGKRSGASFPQLRARLQKPRIGWFAAGGVAVAACLIAVALFVGTIWNDSEQNMALLAEDVTEAGEAGGSTPAPTTVVTTPTVTPAPTTQATATPEVDEAPSEAADGAISVFDLTAGDCFNDPESLDEGMVNELSVIDCSEPHDNELFATLSHPAPRTESYPGEEEVRNFASEGCLEAFESYVGVSFLESELLYMFIEPSEASWEAGDREVLCFLYERNRNKLEGSMKGTNR